MKITIKKEVMKEMRMPHLQFINKKGKPIVRKNELQQMVCKAQLKVKGKLSKSVTEYIDSNGHHKFEMSTGWYNVAFGHWVEDGLLTRSREEGYKITKLGRLFASTDTRAYEIELWKSKFNKEKVRRSNYQDLYLEYRNKYKVLKNQYDEKNSLADEIITQFGEEFAMSDNKGSLQTYDGNYNSPLKSLPSNSSINNCLSNIQNEIESIKHIFKE